MSNPSLGAGDVEISILGKEYTMKPTLAVAKLLSKKFGGGIIAVSRINQFDIEAYVDVISAGLSLTERGESAFADGKGLASAIFETGLMDLAAPCIRFVHIVINGGRPPSDGDEAAPLEHSE